MTRTAVHGLGIPAIGLVNAVAVALLPLRLTAPTFTHPSTFAAAAAADVVAGIALLGSGLIATRLRPDSAAGSLAVLASVAWFATDWVGWQDAPPVVRGVAMVVAPVLAAVVLHLVAATSGALGRTAIRRLVVGAYVLIVSLGVMLALVRVPLLDLACLAPPRNCEDGIFLIWRNPELAARLEVLRSLAVVAVGLGLAALSARWLAAGTGPARRVHWPMLVAGALVGLAGAAYAGVLLVDRGAIAADRALSALFLVLSAALTALAIALGWTVVRARRIASAMARLATDFAAASAPGGLQAALARSLGDPDLAIAYRLPIGDSLVDAGGMPVSGVPTRAGQVATPIVRSGERIAVVVHDAGLVESGELDRSIGPATRLAIDNERLNAAVQVQLRELVDSRSRIVETGDAARRRLERDLHDGAQQRLLTLSYECRLGRAAAVREDNSALAAAFDRAIAETQAALDELRELAHGIFPAVLAEAGLGAALSDLVDHSAVPVNVSAELDGRCSATSERAAYIVIDEAVRSAASRGATHVRIEIVRLGGLLRARITDDASRPGADWTHLRDRASAAGGSLADGAAGTGLALVLEVPCA